MNIRKFYKNAKKKIQRVLYQNNNNQTYKDFKLKSMKLIELN